jgi:hypothetical protein
MAALTGRGQRGSRCAHGSDFAIEAISQQLLTALLADR